MNRKRKKRVLKIYVSLLISVFCFFVMYSYRNDVLRFIKQDDTFWHVSEKQIKELNHEFASIPYNLENQAKIKQLLNTKLEGYDYNTYSETNPDIIFSIQNASKPHYPGKISQPQKEVLTFQNAKIALLINPTFNDYYKTYAMVGGVLSIGVFFLIYYLLSLFTKKQWLEKITSRLPNIGIRRRLSWELVVVNVVAGSGALLLCLFLYYHQEACLSFVGDLIINDESSKIATSMQSQLKDISISDFGMDNSKRNEIGTKVLKILGTYGSNTTMQLVAEKDQGFYFRREATNIYNVRGASKLLNYPMTSSYTIKMQDGYAQLYTISYALIDYVNPYQYSIVFIAGSFYLIILMLFIQKKVNLILKLQEDVDVMASGDLQHLIQESGKDEIAVLAKNLNSMRESLYTSMEKEKQLQDTNKELITSMSHDIRTPLTSLMGYLDILRYQKGDKEKEQEYLDKAVMKAQQIKVLSNQMFEYFLVYGQDENILLHSQTTKEWMEYIEESVSLLQLHGYKVKMELAKDGELALNMMLMKRAMDNIFSNLEKYADINKEIWVCSEVKEDYYLLIFRNTINQDVSDVESTNIGLKSIDRIIELHHGVVEIKQGNNEFIMVIRLSLLG